MVSVTDAQGARGEQGVVVAINLNDLGGRSVYGIDLELNYDAALLQAIDVSAGNLPSGWNISFNTNTAGRVSIALYGTSALRNSGTLTEISFNVFSSARSGDTSRLTLSTANFNEQAADGVIHGTFIIK